VPNAKGKPARRDAFADLGGAGGAAQYFAPQNPVGVEDLAEAKSIAVDLLESNPYQPRTTFDAAALAELAADIAAHGVLQPLLVRPHPDASKRGHYQIVAGERRWRAAQQAGKAEVPCIERAMGDEQMERLALVENIQRTDLAPVDEARAYRRMINTLGVSQRDLAASVHKHHEYIAQRLRLLDDPRIEDAVEAGVLGPTVGQELARVDDEATRGELLDRAARGERITVQHVKDTRRPVESPMPLANNSPQTGPDTINVAQGPAVMPHTGTDDAPRTQRADTGELLTPLNRVRASTLTIDERERYRETVYKVLRVVSWPALEALLEFGMLENMNVKTLLRLCRETRDDKGMT